MKKKSVNNIKLGIFSLAGLLFLVLLLYMVGRNQDMFGSTFTLKVQFDNAQGLVAGNNVRYSGLEIGTVKKVSMLNDTLIEVVLVIQQKMKPFIRNNTIAYIGTEGLVGNKVVNLAPSALPASPVQDGDILPRGATVNTDDMLRVLSQTNNDVAFISAELKNTVMHINSSIALWKLLDDSSLPAGLNASVANVQAATFRALTMASDLQAVVADMKSGKGSIGNLLRDTSLAVNLQQAIQKIGAVGDDATDLAATIRQLTEEVRYEVNNGKGAVNALLKDTTLVNKLNASLDNIQNGTNAFSQNMEALKHNILFRGYFRRLEKQRQKTGGSQSQ